jgi:hypothetical protein
MRVATGSDRVPTAREDAAAVRLSHAIVMRHMRHMGWITRMTRARFDREFAAENLGWAIHEVTRGVRPFENLRRG